MRRESQKFSLFVSTTHIIITSINNINRSLVPPKTLIFFPQIFFLFASQEILFKSREWFLRVKGVNSIKAYLYIQQNISTCEYLDEVYFFPCYTHPVFSNINKQYFYLAGSILQKLTIQLVYISTYNTYILYLLLLITISVTNILLAKLHQYSSYS